MPTDKVPTELLPCPLCNGEAKIILRGNAFTKRRSAEIFCTECGVEQVTGAVHNSLEWCSDKAIQKWNKRDFTRAHLQSEDMIEFIMEKLRVNHSSIPDKSFTAYSDKFGTLTIDKSSLTSALTEYCNLLK